MESQQQLQSMKSMIAGMGGGGPGPSPQAHKDGKKTKKEREKEKEMVKIPESDKDWKAFGSRLLMHRLCVLQIVIAVIASMTDLCVVVGTGARNRRRILPTHFPSLLGMTSQRPRRAAAAR